MQLKVMSEILRINVHELTHCSGKICERALCVVSVNKRLLNVYVNPHI